MPETGMLDPLTGLEEPAGFVPGEEAISRYLAELLDPPGGIPETLAEYSPVDSPVPHRPDKFKYTVRRRREILSDLGVECGKVAGGDLVEPHPSELWEDVLPKPRDVVWECPGALDAGVLVQVPGRELRDRGRRFPASPGGVLASGCRSQAISRQASSLVDCHRWVSSDGHPLPAHRCEGVSYDESLPAGRVDPERESWDLSIMNKVEPPPFAFVSCFPHEGDRELLVRLDEV